jgi:ATP-dependent RNA helicase DDX10/DBP4
VLDEADRLLDLGFLPALRAIVSHFSSSATPSGRPDRQTLLFSATQSKDLASLAKLSLHDPLYINCNKPGEEGVMPSNLEQSYAVVGLERKLDALWGFVKSHLKMKGVVFVTSGKQVRPRFRGVELELTVSGARHLRDLPPTASRSPSAPPSRQAKTTYSTIHL